MAHRRKSKSSFNLKLISLLAILVILLLAIIYLTNYFGGSGASAGFVESLVLVPTDDAYVVQTRPNSNYGGTNTLKLVDNPIQIGYIKFDLSGIRGLNMTSMKLRLHKTGKASSVLPTVNKISNTNWKETAINYNNRPQDDPGSVAISGVAGLENWVDFELLEVLKDMQGQTVTLVVKLPKGKSDFNTKESNSKPKLILSHLVEPTPTPTAIPTPVSTPTSSPLAAPPPPLPSSGGGAIWSADMETGNQNQWTGESNSGSGDTVISTAQAHTGTYSLAATVYNATDGDGTRNRYEGRELVSSSSDPRNLPDEAYYSAWYYVPQFMSGNNNIFQWKQAKKTSSTTQTREPTFYVSLRDMKLSLATKINTDGSFGTTKIFKTLTTAVPTGQWFQIECFYKWSLNPDGAVKCWLDGTEIFNYTNVRTMYTTFEYITYPRQWTANNYANSPQTPATHTIYIDDAKMSSSR